MEYFKTLNPEVQITSMVLGTIIIVIFILAFYTNFFNRKK